MELYKQQRLVFAYLCGILDEKNNRVEVKQVNSMKFAFQEFEEEILSIQDEIKHIKENENVLELFCIIGNEELISNVDEIFNKSILNFFEKIVSKDLFQYKKLLNINKIENKSTLNTLLFLYLKHLVYDDHIRYPIKFLDDKGVISLCYYSNYDGNTDRSTFAKTIYDIWYQNEQPSFFGKQVITKSFMLDDLNGRRIISHFSDNETGETCLLLEGGLKVYLRANYPYFREKINRFDFNVLSIGELDTIIFNPIYAFNKYYRPYELYEDWQKVLNYVLAISNINWNINNLQKIHKNFMLFMEKEICEIEYVNGNSTIISKKEYYTAYICMLQQIRNYFSGKDEMIISKEYLQMLTTRYIFLPAIFNIIGKTIPKTSLFSPPKKFIISEYRLLLENLNSNNSNDKGKALENIAEYLINCSQNLQVMKKRLRTAREEIDLSCCNISLKSNIWKLGALILIECKNWKNKVGVDVIRELSYIMSYKGNSTTILFAAHGITNNAKNEILNYALIGKNIICIDKEELKLIHKSEDFENLLCKKYNKQVSHINNSIELLGA